MIHQFQLNGYNIVVDVYSGSVHAVDPLAYDAIALIDAGDSREQAAAKLAKKYADHPEVTDADIADAGVLRETILSERWRVNLAGYITGEELIDEVIEAGLILPQNSKLNRYTRMDEENYYVQAGDMHEIDELLKEIRDRRGDAERCHWQS